MPNLAGILDLRAKPKDIASVLRRFARILRVEGVDYQERSWQDDRFGAVNLLNGISGNLNQPAISADGNFVMFLDGEIYNDEELRAPSAQSDDPRAGGGIVRLCLTLYETHGDCFVELLNGEFNILLYDRRARRVKMFNDRWACRPFYYLHEKGLSLFAVEKKAIFAACDRTPELDPLGILELFTFGHNLENRTVFRSIQAMPPGSILEFDGNGFRIRHYWRPSYSDEGNASGLAETAEELGRRLCRAAQRRAKGRERLGIFLSGGLDSRAVAGALAKVPDDVTAFTFGGDDSVEVRYARQMSERLGFRHRQLRYDKVSFLDALPRVVWRTECSLPFHQTLSIEQHRYIHPEADVIFNGHFGDALSGGHLLPQLFMARKVAHVVKHILAKRTQMRLPQLRHVFRGEFLDRLYPEMFDAVRRTLASLEEDRMPLLYNLWDMTVRQRRLTFASPAIDRYLFEQITPFVDNDVVDWALRMPLRFLVGQRAYKRMILDTFAEIADVPWARTGGPVPRRFWSDIVRLSAIYAGKRLRRLVPWPRHGTGDGSSLGQLRDPLLRRRIERYIGSDSFLSDVFDRVLLVDMLERHFERGENFAHAVSCLLTLAEGSRLFLEQDLDCPPLEVRPQLTTPL